MPNKQKTTSSDCPVIGHHAVLDFLQKSIENENFAQAYLFYGPKGMGKGTAAKHFISDLLCEQHNTCSVCVNCDQLSRGIHPDVYWLKPEEEKKNITIEQARNLIKQLHLGSFLNQHKIAVIRDAQLLTIEAANALLKTLEEPKNKVIIILLATQTDSLPQTIVSRCQILRFLPVDRDEIYEHLLKVEKIERKKALDIASLTAGRPGLAFKFLSEPEVLDEYKEKAKIFTSFFEKELSDIFKYIEQISGMTNTRQKLKVLEIWNSILRDFLLIKLGQIDLITNFFLREKLKQLAAKTEISAILSILNTLRKTKVDLMQNVNTRLALENVALQIKI